MMTTVRSDLQVLFREFNFSPDYNTSSAPASISILYTEPSSSTNCPFLHVLGYPLHLLPEGLAQPLYVDLRIHPPSGTAPTTSMDPLKIDLHKPQQDPIIYSIPASTLLHVKITSSGNLASTSFLVYKIGSSLPIFVQSSKLVYTTRKEERLIYPFTPHADTWKTLSSIEGILFLISPSSAQCSFL